MIIHLTTWQQMKIIEVGNITQPFVFCTFFLFFDLVLPVLTIEIDILQWKTIDTQGYDSFTSNLVAMDRAVTHNLIYLEVPLENTSY